MKFLIPLALRIRGRQFINRYWGARNYDSPLFGLLWSLTNRDYKTEGLKFHLPHKMMPMGFRSRFYFDAYEGGERVLCKKHLTSEDCIIELGACVGVVSCVCNQLLKDRTKHVVVEANPLLIPWLEKNRAANEASFHIEHGMLSKSNDGNFRIEKYIVSGSANTTSGELIKVPVFDLETICQKYKIIPTVIVMDIEGGEIDFISENQKWLDAHKEVTTMVIEMHPFIVGDELIENSKATLKHLGFSLVENIGFVEAWKRL
jgi:FkbM family methyltransferase